MKASSGTISAKILKVLSVFSGVQAIGILCSVVRTKFISLWIGEAGVGLFAIFNSVIELVSNATQLNLRQSAVRDISASPSLRVPHIAAVVRWWALRLGLLGALVMLMFCPLLSYFSFGDFSYWLAFALLSVTVFALAYSNGEYAIMQGSQQLKPLAKSTAAAAVIGTALSIPLYYLFGLASVVPSLLIFGICGACVVYKYNTTHSATTTRQECISGGKDFLRLGLYLTVSMVVTALASYIFLSYLNITASTATVGLYQAGYTLVIRYVGIVFTALAMEYYPRLVGVAHRRRMASTVVSHEIILILYVLTPLLVLFIAFDDIMVRLLYKESFCVMLPFVTIGIGATIFRVVSYCMAYVIISRGDGRTYIITEVLSSAIGLTLNITMYNLWSFAGLGISYVLWYIIYTLIVGVVYHRYGMRLSRPAIMLTVASALIVAAASIAKPYGYLPLVPIILISLALSYYGYRRIIKKS